MTLTIFLVVLFAALIHASWNALVKSTGDKLVSMTAVTIGHAPLAILAMPFIELPAAESWPWLAASVVCHTGYQLMLATSYRLGDFTQVYPIARGAGPAIVMLVSMFALSVVFRSVELAAVLLICAGIFCLALLRKDGIRNPQAVGAALITGCFIAGYSLLDGMGARAAGTAFGYIAWLLLINAIVFSVLMGLFKRSVLIGAFTHGWKVMLVGGSASMIAYVLVVWAMTQAPIALVTALRETSTIFALFIGVVFLKEGPTRGKIFATCLTLGGVLLLRMAG